MRMRRVAVVCAANHGIRRRYAAQPWFTSCDLRCRVGTRATQTYLLCLNPDAAVFHLAAVAFQADGAGIGKLEGGIEGFAVAGAIGDAVFGDDDHFVPVLGLIFLQHLVRPGEWIVTAL